MNKTQNFSLQFLEPCFKNWFLPPQDPLGELSHLEMGLRRFCFEKNHTVLVKIGDKRQEIFLDPDIVLILDELPEKIYQLLIGQKIELGFPETGLIIVLEPIDTWIINCIWHEYGYSLEQKSFTLKKDRVLDVLQKFLNQIISKAVEKGYITDVEKDEFMIRMLPS